MVARLSSCLAFIVALTVQGAFAQTENASPDPVVELVAGYAGFVDDATIDHLVVGTAARFYLSPRMAVGPELVYMRGPNFDRDLFLTGNLTFDFFRPRGGRPRSVSPFLVAGGGFFQHRDRFGPLDFTSFEGAFTAGGGVRGWVTDRISAFADVRFGWELHTRVNGGIGIRLGR